MIIKKLILPATLPLIIFKKKIQENFGIVSKPKLRILLFHNIEPDNMEKFYKILLYLLRKWDFISPENF